MRNIILIGNGFDLAHNMPTSYNQFIVDLAEKAKLTPGPNTIVKFIEKVSINDFFVSKQSKRAYVKINKSEKYVISTNNCFLLKICREIDSQNWCDIENLYFSELKQKTNQNII